MADNACLICSTASSGCSPMNFKVTCKDSGLAQRASGAKPLAPATKRAIRWRMSSSISRAIKRRIGSFQPLAPSLYCWLTNFLLDLRSASPINLSGNGVAEKCPLHWFRTRTSLKARSSHINFFLSISSAMVEAKRRIRLRSPGKLRCTTSVPRSLATA